MVEQGTILDRFRQAPQVEPTSSNAVDLVSPYYVRLVRTQSGLISGGKVTRFEEMVLSQMGVPSVLEKYPRLIPGQLSVSRISRVLVQEYPVGSDPSECAEL